MANFITVLNMGGYAAYVWPSYLLVVLVFIGNAVLTKRQLKKTRNQLHRWLKSEQA